MRKLISVIAALAAGTLIAGCGSGGTAPGTTSTTSAPQTTSPVVYGNAFGLVGPIHGSCNGVHSDAAKTGTVKCGLGLGNKITLGVKMPPGAWKTYTISYSGTTIWPKEKVIYKGALYLEFVSTTNVTIKKVTFTTTAQTTSAVVFGNAFQLAHPIHGFCTAEHSDAAKTGTVMCGLGLDNSVTLGVKIPPGAWKTYSISYSGTTIGPSAKGIIKGWLYLAFISTTNDTIKKVTFTS